MTRNSKEDMLVWEVIQICNKMLKYGLTLQDIIDFLEKFNYESKIRIKKFHTRKFNELSSIFSNEEKTDHYCKVLNYIIYSGYYSYMNCNFFKFKILMNATFDESIVQQAIHHMIKNVNKDTDSLLEKVKEIATEITTEITTEIARNQPVRPNLLKHAARF